MVLLAGPGPEGGGARCVSPQPPSPPRETKAREDPADYEEYDDFSHLPDTRSIASDDSFYPTLSEEEYSDGSAESVPGVPEDVVREAGTLLSAASTNDVGLLKALVRRGPSAAEVQETDPNGRVSRRRRPRRVRVSAVPPMPRTTRIPTLSRSRGDFPMAKSALFSLFGREAPVKPRVVCPSLAGGGASLIV